MDLYKMLILVNKDVWSKREIITINRCSVSKQNIVHS